MKNKPDIRRRQIGRYSGGRGCRRALAAFLPENSASGSPFIEVAIENTTYGYSPAETCFLAGQWCEYSLVLGPDGLSLLGNHRMGYRLKRGGRSHDAVKLLSVVGHA